MSLTYTTASDRDQRRIGQNSTQLRTGHLLLLLTSMVAPLVLVLAYQGRRSTSDLLRSTQPAVEVTNLNTVSDAQELEPVLEHLFVNPDDRKFTAQGLFDF